MVKDDPGLIELAFVTQSVIKNTFLLMNKYGILCVSKLTHHKHIILSVCPPTLTLSANYLAIWGTVVWYSQSSGQALSNAISPDHHKTLTLTLWPQVTLLMPYFITLYYLVVFNNYYYLPFFTSFNCIKIELLCWCRKWRNPSFLCTVTTEVFGKLQHWAVLKFWPNP